jgi:hypothetical protein
MKKLVLLSILLCFSYLGMAQYFKISFDPVFKDVNGNDLSLALAGGLNYPQFSNLDLNNDGKQDLFVYDRSGDKVLTFIARTNNGTIKYEYSPEYEEFFPKGQEFMRLKDFNGDGKPDLWFYDGDSLVIYRNATTGLPNFVKHASLYAHDLLSNNPTFPNQKVNQVSGCLPGIEDLDNDGDFDIVTNLNSVGSGMILYLNNTVDSSKNINDISYEIPDKCYGGIDEYQYQMITNAPCYYREAYKKKKHFATKTLLFFDNDDDGDYDLFYGSSEKLSNPIYFFKNGRKDLGDYYKDTFVAIDTAYFPQAVESLIPTAPAMSLVDIDLDGEMDLILSTNETVTASYPIHQSENVLYFHNSGTTTKPKFDYVTNKFLVSEMNDYGAHTAPTFADIDGDGDKDLIVATNGDHYKTADSSDYLILYENIGNSSDPIFQLKTINFVGLKQRSYRGLVPTFADLDNNGTLDLLVGKTDGTISYYRNSGSSSTPAWTFVSDNYQSINAGGNIAPSLCDLNGDGLSDLLIGSYEGTIKYYKNTGSATNATFTLQDDSLGGILVNELIRQTFLGPSGFFDSIVPAYWGYSVPALLTLQNGAKVIAAGSDQGKIRLYKVSSDLTANFEEMPNYMNRAFSQGAYTKDWGARTFPAAADLNGDGISDIMLGNNRGGLHYMEGLPKSVGIEKIRSSFYIAPNPSQGSLTVFAETNSKIDYTIIDINGRTLQEGNTYSGVSFMLSSALANGVYFLQINADEKHYLPQKLVLFR